MNIKKLQLAGQKATLPSLKKHVQAIKNNKNFSPKMKYLLKISKKISNVTFLDVGCQMGEFIYHLSKEKNFSYLKGIDIEKEYIELGKKYFINNSKKANLFVQDLFEIKNEKYDLVFMSEVIEHVDRPMAFVKKIYELLKPGGYFIITTPNALGTTNILLNLKHFKNLKYIETEERGVGTQTDHYYCWDKLTLFRLCNSAGFKYVEHHITNKFKPLRGQSIIMIVRK